MPLPALAIAGIGAGVGGLLSGLLHKPKKNYTLQNLIDMGYKPYDETKELSDWSNKIYGMIQERRANATQKSEALGINAPTSIYRSESDLTDAFAKGKGDINKTAAEEDRRVSNTLFNLNYAEDQKNSLGQDILGGIFSGASIGSSIANLTEKIKTDPKDVIEPTEELTKITPVEKPVVSDTILNLGIEKLPSFPKITGGTETEAPTMEKIDEIEKQMKGTEGNYNHSTGEMGDNSIFKKYFGSFLDNQMPELTLNGLVGLNPELRAYKKLFS
jgi:hypothetical protein